MQQKLNISLGSALLFGAVNSPFLMQLCATNVDCPTSIVLVFRALIFFALTYASMSYSDLSAGVKLKHTLYGTLIAFLVANPATYLFTRAILGDWVASETGCPTLKGLLLHTCIYCMFLFAVMYLPESNE